MLHMQPGAAAWMVKPGQACKTARTSMHNCSCMPSACKCILQLCPSHERQELDTRLHGRLLSEPDLSKLKETDSYIPASEHLQ